MRRIKKHSSSLKAIIAALLGVRRDKIELSVTQLRSLTTMTLNPVRLLWIGALLCAWIPFSSCEHHVCDRECEWPHEPKKCEYEFTVEWFYTMSKACYNCPFTASDCLRPHCVPADGYARPIISVNRMLPGPSIRVCHNDTISVKVINRLENGEGVTIHWHGLYARDDPYMDGVPMLTQCPIPAGTSFTYELRAVPPGTHWWHSHSGMQRSDGLAGPLIINRPRKEDPHSDLFDVDSESHVVFVSDWLHQLTLTKFVNHHHSSGSNKGENILINGKGRFEEFMNVTDNSTHYTAREVFTVEKGRRFRFRVISNAAVFCPFEVSETKDNLPRGITPEANLQVTIDNHELNVIASDGADFTPYLVTSLVVHGGERFDFVVNASHEISNYWFRVQGMADCRNQSQLAILRYAGSPDIDPTTSSMLYNDTSFLQLNPWNEKETERFTQVTSLQPTFSQAYMENGRISDAADQTHFIGFDFMKVDNPAFHDPDLYPISSIPRNKHLYSPQFNNITFVMPEYPMLTQPEYIKDEELCDPESPSWDDDRSRFCENDFCSCPYVIDVELDSLVELVIYDEGWTFDAGHPVHLHGNHFYVVAMDKVGSSLSSDVMKDLHANGSITYNFNAILKDTVIIPDGGYTVVRFLADNPGTWLFHCHLAFHSQIGMELFFRVGTPDQWVLPPDDFPKCGSWPAKNPESRSSRNLALTSLILALQILTMIMCRFNWQ